MGILRVITSLKMKNGLLIDDVVNTWHVVQVGEFTILDTIPVTNALTAFYNSIDTLLGAQVSVLPLQHTHKSYTVDFGGPGAADDDLIGPLTQVPFSIGAVSAAGGPAEVAVCLSMTADGAADVDEEVGNTRPKARHRGRVYIGPMSPSTGALEGVTFISRPANADMLTLLNAGAALADALVTADMSLAVYSRVDGIARSVASLHVDNAWDTIRSRGQKATARQTVQI